MVFNTPTDPILAAAFWAGIVSLALTLVLGVQILYLRNRLRRTERLHAAVTIKWRPILHAAIVGDIPERLPRLNKNEYIAFLRLWIYMHESLRGEASEALNAIARQLACERIAQDLLASGNRTERLLAVLVLGRLRVHSSWKDLQDLAMMPDSIISIYAFWALVRIDASAAIGQTMQSLITRRDWPVTRIVLILQEAPEACTPAINQAIADANSQDLPRLLQIADVLRIPVAPHTLARLFRHGSTEVLIAVLKLAQSPEFLPRIAEALSHPDWRVRLQAARAVGRVGGRAEIGMLVKMLGDEQWWVRYRTAQALISLPYFTPASLEQLRQSLTDRYAADIMRHVMSEKGMA